MIPVLDKLIGIIMKKLVDAGIKEIVAILGVNSEMEDLQRNVKNIRLVLVDLETKKIESNSIALWLAELREVLYDAEDLLDDFADARRRKSENVKDILRFFLVLPKVEEALRMSEISTILRNINSNLSRITSETSILQLLACLPNADKKVSRYNSSRITGMPSLQLDSEIVGIDDDATDLVDQITGDSKRAHSMFAITGMCGIGKTTLARKVFHHQLIQDHFNKNTVWVCVSSNCTGEYLLKKIVRSFDKNYSESRDSLDELSSKLIEVVKEKRVFIVLDDIWDSRVWEKFLRVPLSKAEKHSRILITTRNKNVAKAMNAAHTHPMTNMLQSDGWSMLCKIVFKEETGRTNKLEKVGKEIVDRCKGLPLAINVVGGVLRETDRTIDAWTRVLSSTTWSMQDLPEYILPSLWLSYEDLPSHLKRCFIYCSLFPQDFNFHPTKLMYMWIAEGFIHKEEGTRMEESAKEYYNELVMRNLLQVTLYGDGSTCKMHDLIHSLAIFVSQNQYIYVDPKTFDSSGSIRRRHLRFSVENINVDSKEIRGREYVRTLILSTNTEIEEIPDELLSGQRRLRVLDLEGIKIERLPEDSVGNMRQLRFLSISARELHMLPDSIENLENLETLMIASVLTSRSLPKGIGKLRNLRHLLVSGRLQNMPNGLDNLKKLRVLDCFVVNECTSSSTSRWGVWPRKKSEDYKPNMKELKDLSELTDLSIHNLERVSCKEEAEEAAIERKTSLKCLTLSCEPPPRIINEDIRKIEEVFAGIEIPENLTELSIDGFFGKQLPDQMGWSRLHQVKSLELKHCKSLKKLPSLGDMPKLETLHIKYLSVADFGSDFVGLLKFPKLQHFRLMEMKELVNMFKVEIGAFPCLVNLHISSCPKLKSLGEGLQHATCLKKMTVIDVSELVSIENLSSISELEMSSNPSLRSVKNLPSLKKMDINECPALEVVKDVRELSSLSISDAQMNTLPVWLKNTIASEKWHLTVTDSEEFVRISKRVEVKINGVKVDNNFPGASSSSGTSREPVNDFMDVDNSSIVDDITEEISSTSSSVPNPVLQPKTPSNPVLDKLIEIIMGKLVDAGIKKIASIPGVESEMEALQRNVKNISIVLVDAESKNIGEKSIARWLAELREVLYDAEDLLDDFADAQRRKFKSAILHYIFRLHKIKAKSKISKKLGMIYSELEKLLWIIPRLQLLASQPNADNEVSRYNSSRITGKPSFQLDSEIVGIDDDATDLVDRITGDSNRAHSLFAITGMGGIGKTTLARKVFNHHLIQDHFNKNTVWVCVSSNCAGEYLLKKIVRSFDKNYSESRDSLDELSSKLIEVVKEKRVFIVLDDIWDSGVWEKFLRVPLLKGANYSRILITTRNQQVAMKMNAAHTHRMTEMNLSDGWSMLCKIVFKEEDMGDMNELADVGKEIVHKCKGLPLANNVVGGVLKMKDRSTYKFEKVGKEIVDRCKGLPLAIKVVGRVVKMKDRTIDAWTRVLSSTKWSMQDLLKDVLPSLLLSYEDLPLHLKQCFAYCSLFPENYEISRFNLEHLWIAEGFIEKVEGKDVEYSARDYYDELVMRNLLQVLPLNIYGESTCKMHDLLRSLAVYVSQNQYIYNSGLTRRHHLSFIGNDMKDEVLFQEIKEKYRVRTLLLSHNRRIRMVSSKLLSSLRRLRVLDLQDTEIKTLPDSLGALTHLRFLNVSHTHLSELPELIKNLKNLETLEATGSCFFNSLPMGISELFNLRCLRVDQLRYMPNGLRNLKNLRVLDCFVVNGRTSSIGCRYTPNMKELKDLSQLTNLSIHNLERVASKEEAEEAAIERKTNLKCLKLHCEPPPLISDEDIKKIEEVFAGIKIPENLTELSIDGFFGKQLPDHMGWSLLHQVKSLELKNCKSLEQLPSLGNMPKLETLHIRNLSVTNFGPNFVGRLKFPKLQDFRLMEMEELVNMFDVEQGAFPCLVNLHISGCPKLKSLGEGLQHATCLKNMTVIDVSELVSIENLRSISELEITRNSSLRSVKNFPSLKKLVINDCPALQVGECSLSIPSDAKSKTQLKNTIPSKKRHQTVTDSEKIDLTEENEHDEVKIKRIKVDSNFPGASSSS